MFARGFAILSLIASSAAVAAPEPKQPTGKWVVHFEAAQCVATREYGTEEKPLHFILKAPALGDVLQMGLVWKAGPREPVQTDGEVEFDNASPIQASLLEFGNRKAGQRVLLVNLPLAELAPMHNAKAVRIRARDKANSALGTRVAFGLSTVDETLALSQVSSLLKMMATCTEDLRRVWNVSDAAQPGLLKEPPAGNVTQLFRPQDYPGIALDKQQTGSTELVMLIDETGKVADCIVTQTSGSASLDAQSCVVIKDRGKFKPAVGQDGKPAKSSWRQRITYKMLGA